MSVKIYDLDLKSPCELTDELEIQITNNGASKKTTIADIRGRVFTGTPALPNGTTATTQTTGDNSTKVATTAYVDAGVATKPAETRNTIGTLVSGATAKATPIDADLIGFADTEASNVIKKMTFGELKAVLKTYFDTLYTAQ